MTPQGDRAVQRQEEDREVADRGGVHEVARERSHVADGRGGHQQQMLLQFREVCAQFLRPEQIVRHASTTNDAFIAFDADAF